jgi:uncharacterized protein YjiS (DUF1127 family)
LIAPRIVPDHYIRINSIVSGQRRFRRSINHGRREKRLRADGLALPQSNHLETSMSATLARIVRPEVTKRANAFAQIFNACWDGIARYFVRRTAIKSLGELDDRALRDIGLVRSQIEAAVHGFITLPDRRRM